MWLYAPHKQMWITRRAFGGWCGGGSLASPGMPAAETTLSRDSSDIKAAAPMPLPTQENKSRRRKDGRTGLDSIHIQKAVGIEEDAAKRREPVLVYKGQRLAQLSVAGWSAVGDFKS